MLKAKKVLDDKKTPPIPSIIYLILALGIVSISNAAVFILALEFYSTGPKSHYPNCRRHNTEHDENQLNNDN
jgi:hypothetical protein